MTIATRFTIRFYSLSQDFTGDRFGSAALFIGLGFALFRKIRLNIYIPDQVSNSNLAPVSNTLTNR